MNCLHETKKAQKESPGQPVCSCVHPIEMHARVPQKACAGMFSEALVRKAPSWTPPKHTWRGECTARPCRGALRTPDLQPTQAPIRQMPRLMKPDSRAQTLDDSFTERRSRQNSDMLIGVRSGYPRAWCKVWLCLDHDAGCVGKSPSWARVCVCIKCQCKFLKVKVQFSSVQSLSCVRLCNPMNRSTPGLPVHQPSIDGRRVRSGW